eukprot:gnl/MRDRNA2_/MRDRNA2_86758_c0_seq1.p1 gnl/MRDRNA2_/MRDRNA2_86758_c0~~gnl/MRDRNA2_/MRDRNA2_86758_c0_seq1.p1  ORF type:complete len:496 (+),score=-25.98 gnl/MRDRNA2_/MRDRNA2_86758_c0_seq1:168-1655(+)
MCINSNVSKLAVDHLIESKCRHLKSAMVKNHMKRNYTLDTCGYLKKIENSRRNSFISAGTYTIQNVRRLGMLNHYCPYFLTLDLFSLANIVVSDHNTILRAKKERNLETNLKTFLVIKDLTNCHDTITEQSSFVLSRQAIDYILAKNFLKVKSHIRRPSQKNKKIFRIEYERLVAGLTNPDLITRGRRARHRASIAYSSVSHTIFDSNILRPMHFVLVIQKIITFFKHVKLGSVFHFSAALNPKYFQNLTFLYCRLICLLHWFEITLPNLFSIQLVSQFVAAVKNYLSYNSSTVVPLRDHSCWLIQCKSDKQLTISGRTLPRVKKIIILSSSNAIDLPAFVYATSSKTKCQILYGQLCYHPRYIFRYYAQRKSNELNRNNKFTGHISSEYGKILTSLAKNLCFSIVCALKHYDHINWFIRDWNNYGFLDIIIGSKIIYFQTLTTDEIYPTEKLFQARRRIISLIEVTNARTKFLLLFQNIHRQTIITQLKFVLDV